MAIETSKSPWKIDRVSTALHLGLGALAAVVATAFTLGASYAHATDSLETLSEKLVRLERDRAVVTREWSEWRSRVQEDLSSTKTDVRWIRSAVEALARRTP